MVSYGSDSAESRFDVIIIGAGLSGINVAHRVQHQLPECKYTILEQRANLGGTWDFFKYPGLRSDSDLFTYGFPWRIWTEKKSIADADSIMKYLKTSVEAEKIDQRIRFNTKVRSIHWSTMKQVWFVDVEVSLEGGQVQEQRLRTNALAMACGYFDYDAPLPALIPGLENFQGTTIHPQSWPEDLDYTGKKVVIVGSGATAITLLPSLALKAGHVTMLQRSPSYIMSYANSNDQPWYMRMFPNSLRLRLKRLQMILVPIWLWIFCRGFPSSARRMFRSEAVRYLGSDYPIDKHFKPAYEPWDQRVCLTPDGDFFRAIQSGKADIITDHIDHVDHKSIHLASGTKIDPDIIVTATGLKLQVGGGIQASVDGQIVDINSKMLWRHSWLQDIPNCAVILGYDNASWTLGVETSTILFCRILKTMQRNRYTSATPRAASGVRSTSYFHVKSTYVQQGERTFPRAGDVGPWLKRSNYFWDLLKAKYSSLLDGSLEFCRGDVLGKAAVPDVKEFKGD
ncbi:hypothetical protein RBB50_000258 [Rhinocladiella similis]